MAGRPRRWALKDRVYRTRTDYESANCRSHNTMDSDPQSFEFTTLDVFTSTRYSGNPLAVVYVPKEYSSSLAQERKQLIAREFNFSETVFFHEGNPHPKIDIFTTEEELPLAGHPVIGSIHFLVGRLQGGSLAPLSTLHTKAGPISITYDTLSSLAHAQIPHNVRIHANRFSLTNPTLGQADLVAQSQTAQLPSSFPVVSIVKGMTFVLIELPDVTALSRVSTTPIHVSTELDEGWASSFVGTYFFVKESRIGNSTTLRTRMIAAGLEDPATGSAASALAAFLSIDAHRPDTDFHYEIVQGVEMGRRSEIGVAVRSNAKGDGIETLTLKGQAVAVSHGTILA